MSVKSVFKAVTDRIRVFLFGIAVAVLGLINPSFALRVTAAVLTEAQV